MMRRSFLRSGRKQEEADETKDNLLLADGYKTPTEGIVSVTVGDTAVKEESLEEAEAKEPQQFYGAGPIPEVPEIFMHNNPESKRKVVIHLMPLPSFCIRIRMIFLDVRCQDCPRANC